MNDFKKLKVWEEAHNLAKEVYLITKKFPSEESFGITSQLRRSVTSIPANIVEGQGRFYKQEGLRFLYIARGSLYEAEYFILLCKELDYIDEINFNKLQEKCILIGKLINGFIKSMKDKSKVVLTKPESCALGTGGSL